MEVVGWSVGDLYCVPALGLRLTNHARSRSLITCSPQRVMYIHYIQTQINTSNYHLYPSQCKYKKAS